MKGKDEPISSKFQVANSKLKGGGRVFNFELATWNFELVLGGEGECDECDQRGDEQRAAVDVSGFVA